jgi:hypothetical protein
MDFSILFIYIGLWWDLPTRMVKLPEKKKMKYLKHIFTWTDRSPHSVRETERIISTLNHICLVVPDRCLQMLSLYKF